MFNIESALTARENAFESQMHELEDARQQIQELETRLGLFLLRGKKKAF